MYSRARFTACGAPWARNFLVLPSALCRHPLRRAADDLVYDPVLDGLLGSQYVVAVGVAHDLLKRLARVVCQDLVHAPLGIYHLPGLYLYVGGLPAQAPLDVRLVKEDPRVGERAPLAFVPAASSVADIEAAMPKAVVATSHETNCMVS